jgi:propionyl-CoA synthetase
LGVNKGDRVLIYMPMIAEAAFAMLACARMGAIHSVVFGGFASGSLASRIEDASAQSSLSVPMRVRRGGKVVEYKPLLGRSHPVCQPTNLQSVILVDRAACGQHGHDGWT